LVHHLARVVVSIFREHTVRSVTNPPSLPHCSTVNSGAVSFDAYHPLAVEGTPAVLSEVMRVLMGRRRRRREALASLQEQ
jgi:hypothetical protein